VYFWFSLHAQSNNSNSSKHYGNLLHLTGESCGEGTLVTLKNTLNDKNLEYTCYNVFGDLMDESQTQDLSIWSSKIITAEQEGNFETSIIKEHQRCRCLGGLVEFPHLLYQGQR